MFQRLSTGPTLPDLIRREADRRARRSLHMLPTNMWLRPATAAVFWQHRSNGLVQGSGGHGGKVGQTRLDRELGHVRPQAVHLMPRSYPAGACAQPVAGSSRATRAGMPDSIPWCFQRQAAMAACFAGAPGVFAVTRLRNWCGLLSPDSVGVSIVGADRLTRTGMRL